MATHTYELEEDGPLVRVRIRPPRKQDNLGRWRHLGSLTLLLATTLLGLGRDREWVFMLAAVVAPFVIFFGMRHAYRWARRHVWHEVAREIVLDPMAKSGGYRAAPEGSIRVDGRTWPLRKLHQVEFISTPVHDREHGEIISTTYVSGGWIWVGGTVYSLPSTDRESGRAAIDALQRAWGKASDDSGERPRPPQTRYPGTITLVSLVVQVGWAIAVLSAAAGDKVAFQVGAPVALAAGFVAVHFVTAWAYRLASAPKRA